MDADSATCFRERLADALGARRDELAASWLERLVDVVQEDRRDIFPTRTYLDHIPLIIERIAEIVRQGEVALALDNTEITRKAIELGELRHEQRASVHQLLREYELLSDLLEDVVREVAQESGGGVTPSECIDAMATIGGVVRSIMRSTIDRFVERYSATIAEQTERLRSLNSFIGHELRTPLQSASLTLEMVLAMRADDEEETRELERVQEAIGRISTLLGNVETLVQAEPGTADDPTRQVIDLSALARDVGEQQRAALEARGVRFEVDDDLGLALVDTARLSLVLSNLIGNAVKYSDPNKSERFVHVRGAVADTAEMVAIAVRDNGLGIAPERREEVFALGARAHQRLDKAHGVSGDGLGLYLVARAVREMGGAIRLESELGRWTEFTLSLPRKPG